LDDGAVHVWRAGLDLEPGAIEGLRLALSPDELARAARFRNPAAQSRFVSARGILRDILSRYLDRDPATLTFGYQPHGKPFLLPATGLVQFNLSHSQGMALCGITRGREIGVDVEMARPGPDQERIAERFYSARAEDRVLLPLLDAQGSLSQGPRRGAVDPTRQLRRRAGAWGDHGIAPRGRRAGGSGAVDAIHAASGSGLLGSGGGGR